MSNLAAFRGRLFSALTVLVAGLAVACGGSGGGPSGPSGPVLSTVDVAPSVTVFNTAPGNTAALSVTPRDQNGTTMLGGTRSFASDNTAVATVGSDGVVTAVSVGTARITTTVTIGSVTRTGTTTVSVAVPPLAATVDAPQLAFQPSAVHVSAGGTVTWNVPGPAPHTVSFTTPGAPDFIPQLLGQSASRTFPTPGQYDYVCTLHVGMTGVVHVH